MAPTKFSAALVAAMLVATAFASVPVAAADESVAVATQYADEVTHDSATLHGNLTALENASEATVWLEYWEARDQANASNTTEVTVNGTGPFHGYPDDLESDTTYVFVAHAATENASAVGAEATFTTEPAEHVEVETGDASAVTNDSATLHGELTVLRSDEDATVWFEYWAVDDPDDVSQTPSQELDGPGTFNAAVDGLDSGTEYVFVAHAESGNLSDSGAAVEFATEAEDVPLGVETDEASDVANDSATLEGELTGLGENDTATVYFEYWVEGHRDGSATTSGQTLDGPGEFAAAVDGLENDTTYVYVAHARTAGGEVTGDEVEFTTDDGSDESARGGSARDGGDSFGQWLSSWIHSMLPYDGDTPFGQLVSEFVHENNPGGDKRADGGSHGGNGNGPPDHAGGDDGDDEDDDES